MFNFVGDVNDEFQERIQRERFGGVLGVSAGSEEPPAFVAITHHRGGDTPTLALVGKGVTFDSGGLSLKPTASMEDMKSDMTGAPGATPVLGAGGFGQITGSNLALNPRQYQFALKLIF